MGTITGVPVAGDQPSKAEQITQEAAAVAATVDPALAPEAQAAGMVEPVVESLVRAIMSLFHHHKQVVAALQPKQ